MPVFQYNWNICTSQNNGVLGVQIPSETHVLHYAIPGPCWGAVTPVWWSLPSVWSENEGRRASLCSLESIQTLNTMSPFAVLVLQLHNSPHRVRKIFAPVTDVNGGERKAIPLAIGNIHFLDSGCCPYAEIRWKIKEKYLCQDGTKVKVSGKGDRSLSRQECYQSTSHRNFIESQNILSCKRPITITEPNFWLHIRPPKIRPYVWECCPDASLTLASSLPWPLP